MRWSNDDDGWSYFWIAVVVIAVGGLIWKSEQDDLRPEPVKWVEDVRNDCKLREELPLANHVKHVKKNEYQPKVLSLYDCKGGLTAALIREVKDASK